MSFASMASFFQKVRTAAKNPELFGAYLWWLGVKAATGSPPDRRVSNGVKISHWLGFSEYWSFREGIPFAERQFIKSCLGTRSSTVAVDIGANIGLFSCFLASHPSTQVHAFEPVPETFGRLERNVASNRLTESCHLNCLAVGRQNELLPFRLDPRSPATNRLLLSQSSAAQSVGMHRVQAIRLDDYCQNLGLSQIDFLKIDVEGMEPQVIAGARGLLRDRKIGAILMEICPANLFSVGESPETLFDAIVSIGYKAFEVRADGAAGRQLTLEDLKKTVLDNIVLLPG